MYALVMFVCYLDGGCSEMVVDILRDEPQCLIALKEQNLRHAGCYPMEEFIDGFWLPASEYSDFNAFPTNAEEFLISSETSSASEALGRCFAKLRLPKKKDRERSCQHQLIPTSIMKFCCATSAWR